ncbi:hypothetical protein RJ640_006269 [Escallonia rubra]|uniref:Rhomboid protein n=1 Tax=Escallonia rubra TaxID=112253 RepID=A0AA88RVP0_9ASTE|nr:hypothetical protein RJ640_006269 [Escallonia rubra]
MSAPVVTGRFDILLFAIHLRQGTSFYTGFTRQCKGLAVVLVIGHIVVQIFPSAVGYLALIPANFWVFLYVAGLFLFGVGRWGRRCKLQCSYILPLMYCRTIPFAWNLLTAGYIEQSVHGIIITALGLLFIGKLLEPIWGSREFLKFIFIVNFLTSLGVFITAISLYYITRQENYLYMPISGFHGVLSGFLVGIKQIIPDQELSSLRIKAKWLPSITLLLAIVISFFTVDPALYLPTLMFGTYFGWIYLRYMQRKPETKLKGDPSDDFAFSTFFPEFLRPVIDPIASVFDRIFCGRSEGSDDERGHTLGGAPLPGSDSVEASRRR